MKITTAVLLVVLLALPLFAASGREEAQAYAEPSDALATSSMSVPSGEFVLVNLNGADTLLLNVADGKPVTDEATMRTIMTDNIYALANANAKIGEMGSNINTFASSTEPEESQCRQWLGLLNNGEVCTDKESCLRSCFSSPYCDSGPKAAPGFIEAMQSWVASVAKFDSAVSDFNSSISSVKDGVSSVDAQTAKLNAVKAAMAEVQGNGLVMKQAEGCDTCFEFCKQPNYSTSSIDSISSDLSSLKTSLAPLALVNSKATSLKAMTDRELSYQSSKKATYAALSDKVANKNTELKAKANGLSMKVESSGIDSSVSELDNLSKSIQAMGNKGDYRLALSKEAEFDRTSADLEDTLTTLDRKYAALTKSVKDLSDKINTAYMVSGNSSDAVTKLADVKTKLNAINTKLKSPIQESDIPVITNDVSDLSAQMNDILAEAALSGGVKPAGGSPTSAIPSEVSKNLPPQVKGLCGISAILALLAGAAFTVRRKG